MNLCGDFGQNIHALDGGSYSEAPTWAVFYSDHLSVAADPAFFAGGEFRRKNQNQLDVRTFFHAGLGVEEYAIRAHIASLGTRFRVGAAHADRKSGDNSLARTAIDLRSHL